MLASRFRMAFNPNARPMTKTSVKTSGHRFASTSANTAFAMNRSGVSTSFTALSKCLSRGGLLTGLTELESGSDASEPSELASRASPVVEASRTVCFSLSFGRHA